MNSIVQMNFFHMYICIVFALNLFPPGQFNKYLAGYQEKEAQKDLRIQFNSSVTNLPAGSKRYALIIGVDNYEDKQINKLEGAVNDATNLANMLEKNAGFPKNQIVLLTSDQTGEKRASRANIMREMSDMASTVPKDGLLFIAFSGHGMENKRQVFLLPTDAQVKTAQLLEQTAFPETLIAEWFKTRVKQVIVVIDACRSYMTPYTLIGRGGAFVPSSPNPYYLSFHNLNSVFELKSNKNLDERNQEIEAFAIFYATASGKQAYENSKSRQGYLTSAIVSGLEGEAATYEGDITLASLANYVQNYVPKMTKKLVGDEQRPYYSVEGYKAEELIIAKVKR